MGNLGSVLTLGAIVAALVLAFVIILTMADRQRFLTFLVGASAGLAGVQFFNVHVFTFIVVIWVVLAGNRFNAQRIPTAALILVAAAALAVTALTGDLVNSPTLALQLIALAVCAIAVVTFATAVDVRTMLFGLLAVTSASSTWGVLQVAGIAPYDVWHLSISALGRPTGFYPEPDWLGMFAGIGLILAWRLDLSSFWRVSLVCVNTFALVLAFARAAWVATAAAILLTAGLMILDRRRRASPGRLPRRRGGRRTAIVVLAASGSVALASMPAFTADLITRLSRTLVVANNDVSAQARVQQNEGLAILARSAPWYGHGISASGRVGVSGRLQYGVSDNNVGSNWVSSMWVDGSLLAVPLIALLALSALLAAKSIAGQGLILVLLSSFFSNATYQPVAWLLLGICVVTLWESARLKRELRAGRLGSSSALSGEYLESKLPRTVAHGDQQRVVLANR